MTKHKTVGRVRERERERERELYFREKGITLISLVVTIVILLILAAVTINLVLAEGGLFERAQQSEEEHEKAVAREELELKLADMVVEKNTKKEYNPDDYLTEQLETSGFDVDDENTNLVTVDGWQFEIDRSIPKISGQTEKVEETIITRQIDIISYIKSQGKVARDYFTISTPSNQLRSTAIRDVDSYDADLFYGHYSGYGTYTCLYDLDFSKIGIKSAEKIEVEFLHER